MTPATPARGRWLFGPVPDLLFGCNLWYVLLFVVLLFAGPAIRSAQPVYLAPLLILLVSTPHYGATLVRVYERGTERRAYALFTVWLTAALLGLFVVGVHDAAVGTLLFTAYLTWSPWHYTAQNYGIAVMFLRRAGVDPTPRQKTWVHATFVLSFLLTFLVMHRAAGATRGLGEGGVHLARLGIPEAVAGLAIPAVAVAWAVALVVAGAQLLRRATPKVLLPVALLALSQALWFTAPDVVRFLGRDGGIEALGFDQRAVYFNWVVLAHAVQYLWITSYYARSDRGWPGGGRYFAKVLLAGNLVWFLPASIFAPQLFGGRVSEVDVSLLVAALVNLHHFVLDGAIWKLRRSRIADVLIRSRPSGAATAVARGGAARWRPSALVWGSAAVLLAMALVEFGIRDVLIPRLVESRELAAADRMLDRLAWIGRDSATLRFRLGQAFASVGERDRASESIERSAELTPTPRAHAALARLAVAAGRTDEARAHVRHALELAPGRPDVLRLAGNVHRALGDEGPARDYFARARRLDDTTRSASDLREEPDASPRLVPGAPPPS